MEKPSSPERGRRWPFRRKSRSGAGRPRRPLRTIALLPTLITLANGVCGTVAVFKIGIGLAKGGEALYFLSPAL